MTNEVAVAMREFLVERLKTEVNTTKKVLQAIPDDKEKSSYKHDPKSRSAWELAWHLAGVDVQFLEGIPKLSFASMADEADFLKKNEPATIAAMCEWYGNEMERVIERVNSMTPEELTTEVEFFMYKQPAVAYLAFVTSHSIHHRGELATYLRPMGSKVPSIYGPSADEQMGG